MPTAAFDAELFELALRMGDNALILGQRAAEWCGHAPALEEDIAMTNVALDLIGEAKLWLALAGEIEGAGRTADDLAFLRDSRAYRNALLVEQPNDGYGVALMRHFLFDAWRQPMLEGLGASVEPRVAAIANKAAKEATYHFERSRDLVVRLGDGSQESAQRMQRALDQLYPFLGELTFGDEVDLALTRRGVAPDLANVKARVDSLLEDAFAEAGLRAPLSAPIRKGGKAGLHSEAFGLLLAEMQFLQRAYPGAQW